MRPMEGLVSLVFCGKGGIGQALTKPSAANEAEPGDSSFWGPGMSWAIQWGLTW